MFMQHAVFNLTMAKGVYSYITNNFYALTCFYPQTVNPTLTPGRPNQQRKESPAEIPHPPSTAEAPHPGDRSWAGRLSELSISKTSRRNSTKTSEGDSIAAFGPHLPPQHQPRRLPPSAAPAEDAGCGHQRSVSSWSSSLDPRLWCWSCIVS